MEAVLKQDELVLRCVESRDLAELYELIYSEDAPEWKQWDAPYYPLDRVSFERFEQNTFKRMRSDQEEAYPASIRVIEADGELVGMISYYIEDSLSMWLEIGIVIYKPSRWARGIGTRALHMWTGFLFEQMPIVRVGLTTWSGNARMMRAAEKVGFQMEGRLRKCRIIHGEYYDSIRMGLLREEWEQMCAQATDINVNN